MQLMFKTTHVFIEQCNMLLMSTNVTVNLFGVYARMGFSNYYRQFQRLSDKLTRDFDFTGSSLSIVFRIQIHIMHSLEQSFIRLIVETFRHCSQLSDCKRSFSGQWSQKSANKFGKFTPFIH